MCELLGKVHGISIIGLLKNSIKQRKGKGLNYAIQPAVDILNVEFVVLQEPNKNWSIVNGC